MSNMNNVKRIVLDHVCGSDVLACSMEGADVVLHVQAQDAVQPLVGRLQEAFKAQGLDCAVSVRVHAGHAVRDLASAFGSGTVVYDPAGIMASVRKGMSAAANDNAAQSARWGAAAAAALVALGGLHAPLTAHAEAPASAAAKEGLPAVSGPNGKVSLEYNNYDGAEGTVLAGSFSMPIGHSFGAQIDAATGHVDQDAYNAVGAHLFWRDPSKGLVGLIAGTSDLDGQDMIQVGAEGQLYLDQVTLGGRLARQHGNVDDGDVVRLDAGWYVTDNLLLGAYTERAATVMTNNFSVEWQPGLASVPGLAFYASAEQGGHDYDNTTIGVRYYFGANKSLKARHRQDDPPSLFPEKVYKKKRNVAAPYVCGSFCP